MHTNNIDSPQLPKGKQRSSVPIWELTHTAPKMAKKKKREEEKKKRKKNFFFRVKYQTLRTEKPWFSLECLLIRTNLIYALGACWLKGI